QTRRAAQCATSPVDDASAERTERSSERAAIQVERAELRARRRSDGAGVEIDGVGGGRHQGRAPVGWVLPVTRNRPGPSQGGGGAGLREKVCELSAYQQCGQQQITRSFHAERGLI